MNQLEWLVGSEASAVRKLGSKYWSIIENKDLPSTNLGLLDMRNRERNLNIGVLCLLQHPQADLKDDPSIYFQNKWMSKGAFRPSIMILVALTILLILLVMWSVLLVSDFESKNLVTFNWPSLFVFTGGFFCSHSFMSWIESRTIEKQLGEKSPTLHLTSLGLVCNPVVWVLGSFWKLALSLIVANGLFIYGSWRVIAYDLYLGVGLLLGFSFWLAYALMPLKPGPIDSIFKRMFHIVEFPHQLLKWSIEGKILPAGQQIETKSSWTLNIVSLYLITWLYSLLKFLEYVGSKLPDSYYANAMFLEMFISVSGIIISVFFLSVIVVFYFKSWAYNQKGEVSEYEPTQEEKQIWETTSSLLYHIPLLRSAQWKWQHVREATWLIKYGENTRRFYWLQKGEAKIYGRREGGHDVNLLAKLHSGSGFGELALLDSTPRNADVMISKHSILAYLDQEEFEKLSNEFYRKHFRRIVQASQLFDQLEMFQNIPSRDREEWLSRAILLDFNASDILYSQGDKDQWMGLVLEGEIRVEREGREVAHIKRGQIFGEMAFVVDEPRKATLIATNEVVIFRWESGWWAKQANKIGLESHFEQLIKGRIISSGL